MQQTAHFLDEGVALAGSLKATIRENTGKPVTYKVTEATPTTFFADSAISSSFLPSSLCRYSRSLWTRTALLSSK